MRLTRTNALESLNALLQKDPFALFQRDHEHQKTAVHWAAELGHHQILTLLPKSAACGAASLSTSEEVVKPDNTATLLCTVRETPLHFATESHHE